MIVDQSQFIYTLFWTVFFCLGFRTITSEGQLLYFIRQPFEGLSDEIDAKKDLIKHFRNKMASRYLMKLRVHLFVAKPTVLCITCMASFWGLVVFISLNGLHFELIKYMVLNCVSAAFVQTFIWNLYEKYA